MSDFLYLRDDSKVKKLSIKWGSDSMLNEKFLEIIKRVMSEYNYSLVTSIAQNWDESYMVSKN